MEQLSENLGTHSLRELDAMRWEAHLDSNVAALIRIKDEARTRLERSFDETEGRTLQTLIDGCELDIKKISYYEGE